MEETLRLEPMLSQREFAEMANVSVPTIYLWRKKDLIRYYKLGWRTVRFRLSDVQKFIERRKESKESKRSRATRREA